MKQGIIIAILLFLGVVGLSCAEITPPSPAQILQHPLGTDSLRRGMPKEEVLELWGKPAKTITTAPDAWTDEKEEWVYDARYPAIPLDADYLSRTKRLYFEGNILIRWEEDKETK
ncbi:MAG: hypothetical protein KAJ66_03785 [Candidatus Omnitrophica bacterium]|nr:hypothetical protein [Candidatus Omnitrophota bacterium]